jgi:hypothetical protein
MPLCRGGGKAGNSACSRGLRGIVTLPVVLYYSYSCEEYDVQYDILSFMKINILADYINVVA